MNTDGSSNSLDPLGIGPAALEVAKAIGGDPQAFIAAQSKLAQTWSEIATRALAEGTPAQGTPTAPPLIEPASGDSRWKHPAWTQNPMLDALKQGYLLASQSMLDSIEMAPGVDADTKRRVRFFAKQFCDAMSPTNFALLNPAVMEETIRSGGENLQRGIQNIVEDARENEGRPALVDRSAFTVGVNLAYSRGQVVFRDDLMELIQYDATTERVYERPLVIIPPWINKYYILDLQATNSFVKFATDSGFTTFVVSWRNPDERFAEMTMDDYLDTGALAAVRIAAAITGSPSVNLIGYCIGGTLVSMLLAYLARTGESSLINAVTFFAALLDFSDAGDLRVFITEESIAEIEQTMEKRGYLDASEMAKTFNLLRANDLIWNVAVNRYLLGKDAPAFDLLYWNDDATRLPKAMHSFYLRTMYQRNLVIVPDAVKVLGVPIDLGRVRNDTYCVATAEDHIAPWRSVYRMTQLFAGKTEFRLGHSGHIAGIINPPISGKGAWWSAPSNPPDAEAWKAAAVKHPGSWWTDWKQWLAERSGIEKAAPTNVGSDAYPPIVPAPGTYVLERS
ncbi:MAG TPA: class I poly(R)-hydroxyalkanoic acid synthase [Candidatus Baltobacteraceae bacterium]|jgi:polyhydroxyalkanoate synthase|nr:class I poly(R)-hydroxyalkanoic acid synthase [Candidatus Baltobacteraceae bacterium]